MSFANTHTFFCCETDCNAEAHVFGGRCDDCFELHIENLRRAHNPKRCEWCSQQSDLQHSASQRFCSKGCEFEYLCDHDCNGLYNDFLEAYICFDCIDCYPKHICNGDMDYDLGYNICDDRYDDHRCPQYKPPKHCVDCGYVPKDGYFPCYSGNDPLCATCEEAWLGPRSPDSYSHY